MAHAAACQSASLMATHFSIAEDLHAPALAFAAAVLLSWLGLLLWEISRQRTRRLVLLASGGLAFSLVVLSVLRPVRVKSRASSVGPRVVVLADRSRRLLLPADDGERTREAV